MLAPLKVKDYMSATKITFTPEMDVLQAIHQLIEFNISGAPVIDHHGNMIGFLSERDCMKVALGASYQSEAGGRVDEFMRSVIETVDYESSIIEVAERFLETAYKCYPVIKENRIVGSITRHHILKALETAANIERAKKPAKQSTKQQIHVS